MRKSKTPDKQIFAELTVHNLIKEINELACVTVDIESVKYIKNELGDLLLARECFDRSLARMRGENDKSV